MSEISNTIYVFKKVLKQLRSFSSSKKYSDIAKINTEKLRKGINIYENIDINENENENNTIIIEKKAVKMQRNTPWVCDCGTNLLWGGKKLHISTKKHFTNMKNKPIICVVIPEVVIPEVVIPVPKKIIKKVIRKVVKPIEELSI